VEPTCQREETKRKRKRRRGEEVNGPLGRRAERRKGKFLSFLFFFKPFLNQTFLFKFKPKILQTFSQNFINF
jgi:hypothetical protein